MKCPVNLIISGGQSGADLAGNQFAQTVGIPTCCYVFKNFKPVDADDRMIFDGMPQRNIKTSQENYISCLRERTVHNVKRADATILFLNCSLHELGMYSGSRLTWKTGELLDKPVVIVDVRYPKDAVRTITSLLQEEKPEVLNIAGRRSLQRATVRQILTDAWKKLNFDTK